VSFVLSVEVEEVEATEQMFSVLHAVAKWRTSTSATVML